MSTTHAAATAVGHRQESLGRVANGAAVWASFRGAIARLVPDRSEATT